jgi:hypothetical protein
MTEHELGISDRRAYATDCLRRSMPPENTIFCDEAFDKAMCVIWVETSLATFGFETGQ